MCGGERPIPWKDHGTSESTPGGQAEPGDGGPASAQEGNRTAAMGPSKMAVRVWDLFFLSLHVLPSVNRACFPVAPSEENS